MADLRAKVLTYLRDGRVRVMEAATPVGDRRPAFVLAWVKGYFAAYRVTCEGGLWTCTCPDTEICAHMAAVALITGWPSAAAKPLAEGTRT